MNYPSASSTSEQGTTTQLFPALCKILIWGSIFLLFERIGVARYGFSGKMLAFVIIMAFIVGILSALVNVVWGRELEITEQGRIRIRGRRKFVLAAANLADIPAPIVSEQTQTGTDQLLQSTNLSR